MSSWKEIYKAKAAIGKDQSDANVKEGKKLRSEISAMELGKAGFRKDVKSTAPLKQPDKTDEKIIGDTLNDTIKKGGIEGFGASVAKVAETPVIKQALNVLSTGGYAAANTADNLIDAGQNLAAGNARGITDALMAPVTGIAQGLNAGIAQNAEDATTFADVIKHGQDIAGVDVDSEASKWQQGIYGFAGDVLLDPATYLTVGASALAKGAVRGARQGSKTAKEIAEDAIKKSKEVEDIAPVKEGMSFGEIANNPKGRIGTAIQEAKKDHSAWSKARVQRRKDKQEMRNAEFGGNIDEEVGINIEAMQKAKDEENAAKVASQTNQLEAQLEAEVASSTPKDAMGILDEVQNDVTMDWVNKLPKVEETPVNEPKVPEGFTKEVLNTVAEAPVAPVKVNPKAEEYIQQQRGAKFDELANVFQREKYAKQMKELTSPQEPVIRRQIPDPSGEMIKVPRAVKGANSNAEYVGLAAEGKDKAKARAATAGSKNKARLKEEKVDWDNAPHLSDPKYNIILDDDGVPTQLTAENLHSYIDEDVWDNFVGENADMELSIRKNGITSKMKLSQLASRIGTGDSKLANEYLRQNLDKFVHQLDDYEEFKDDIDGLITQHKADYDAHTAPKEADDSLDDIINDEPEYDLAPKMIEVEEPNPNAWSPERATALGIDPSDGVLTPQEIAALKIPMTNAQIIAKIKKGDLPKAAMDMLRALTGKTDAEEVGKEFIRQRKEYDKYLKDKAKPAKVARDSKEAEVSRFLDGREIVKPIRPTDEAIDDIQAEATDLAEEFVKSPVAFDEPYQMEFRMMNFKNAVLSKSHGIPDADLLKIQNVDTGTVGQAAIAEFAHDAVKAALAVQLKEAPHKTGSGMRTMTTDKTTGGAWSPKIWGSDSQLALHVSLISSMQKIFKNSDLKQMDFTKRRFYMAALNIADKELRAAGVEPFLNHVDDVKGKARTNVSLYDMFAALDEAGQINALDYGLFRMPSTSLGVTPIQGAFETLLRMRKNNNSEAAIRTRLRSVFTASQAHHGRPVLNDVAALDNTAKRLGYIIDKNPALQEIGDPKLLARAAKKLDAKTIDKMVDAIMDPTVYRSLTYRQIINQAAHNSSLGNFVEQYATKMVERLYNLADTAGVGSAMKAFNDELRALKSELSPADYEKGKQALDMKLTETVSYAERVNIEQVDKRVKVAEVTPPVVNTPAATKQMEVVQQAVTKTHVEDAKAVETEIADTPKPDDAEPMQIKAAEIATAAAKKMHPIQKLTNPKLGLSTDVYRAVNSGLHSIARQQAHFHQSLSMHLEKYSAASLRTDFEQLQILARNHNEKDPFLLTDDMPASMHELYGIIGTMFEVSNRNVWARNAVGTQHFNALAKANGIPETWRFVDGLSVYDNSHLWATKWEGIGEKGILDFLSKMHSVAVKASQEIAIGASFSKDFGKKVKEEGYVKLRWDNRRGPDKESSFYDLIDHDLYYPKDIAAQVIQVNNLMRESRSLNTSKPLGKFFVNVFDPITNALKASQTTVRPGHWVISVAGDLLRNQLAGINSIQPYRHAIGIMKAGGLDPQDFMGKIDSAEALAKYRKSQETGGAFMATGEGNGLHFFIGGSKKKVSYETMEKILHDVVMLPKHRGGGGVIEDRFVGENVTNKLSRNLERATDFVTDNEKFSLNALAAKRDNFMRISLAVDYASKRKWANVTEMKKGMEDYVTKWAPTSTDMTAFESKYARRTMLYYTWLRGITPRIIDSAMTKPGVTTMVPKALYNLAYANGLNPESIGNPFPEDDGLFPSYYYNNVLGPQWKDDYGMWGINPSSPVIEVANTFKNFSYGDPAGNAEGAAKQFIGMSTPFARMPLEMAMGSQSSGIPIEDNSQYLLDNLGGSYVGALSRATGKTVNLDGIVDRTDSAAKGTPEEQLEHAKLQGINFLTGAKLTDYKSDSAIKAANYDIVDKMKQEVEAQRRGM